MAILPAYRFTPVTTEHGEVNVHYVEAGDKHNPTVLLLHGFPSSTTQFRDLIYLLADDYHVVAPDLPGFGFTQTPKGFSYTFDNLGKVIISWVQALKLSKYAMYVFDYGAPVGWRLALAHPDQVTAIISQNGNAYEAGFGQDFWAPIFKLWSTKDEKPQRELLRENVLTLGTTKFQYTCGVPEQDLEILNPTAWTTDYLQNLAGPENQERQLDLFYDYRTNVPLYPKVHEWFRSSQIPLLAIWGKGDPAFIPAGATAFKADLPDAVVTFVDAGHFALETRRYEIARAIKHFLADNGM